ncbi:MAG: hypothetical protein OXH08_09220 [Gammaproteobacteria bacterium]|nr:hypothetical protein [Gammaproteobacteria bacterium]MDE0649040.1 hypothetical protein [Gammaproteobacteria bacterium]
MAFRSEADAARWAVTRGVDLGATVPLETLGELSRGWYAGRLRDHWRPSSAESKQALLREAGLEGSFWQLHTS